MDAVHEKQQKLRELLASYGSVAVAFSGGVDSSYLLCLAQRTLGERAAAVTAVSPVFPRWESEEAEVFCRTRGIRQILCRMNPLDLPGFRQNPANRCYLCKRSLFETFLSLAREQGFPVLADGSNVDDEGDYRPGLAAVRELGIRSPLREAGLRKEEIRLLSRELGLPNWDKPSFACLASRFVYGEEITEEKLAMVERAETLLLDLGFRQVRVRIHGTLARLELLPEDFPRFMAEELRLTVQRELKALGFRYVSLDLAGYRSGSMNASLPSL